MKNKIIEACILESMSLHIFFFIMFIFGLIYDRSFAGTIIAAWLAVLVILYTTYIMELKQKKAVKK